MDIKVEGAADLWRAIKSEAGLDLACYDEPLLVELAENLQIDASDFEHGLERSKVSIETLLQCVLRAIAPYGAMTRDVLAFFASVGARSSTDNLRFRFDFGEARENFDFDLNNFRDLEERVSEATTKILTEEVDGLTAQQIRHAFVAQGITYELAGTSPREVTPADKGVVRWLRASGGAPRGLPPAPEVRDTVLCELLSRVWSLLRSAQSRPATPDSADGLSGDDVRTIVRGAYLLRADEARLRDALRDAYRDVPRHETDVSTLIQSLTEIFNLPAWKRRSELYSVWVGTRLMQALGEDVRVHVVAGAIEFPFGGAHLATVRLQGGENLHVWCELRTSASALRGKGRKKAIQPDYVVLREPTSHPDSAALVVECKQYLRQDTTVFSDALIDYARHHRLAQVVLASYGSTTAAVQKVVEAIDKALGPRTRVLSMFRPGVASAQEEFDERVRKLVAPTEPASEVPPTTVETQAAAPGQFSSGHVKLAWEASVDLDLHAWMTDARGVREHVFFESRRAALGPATVELDQDARARGGETVTWRNAAAVELEFAAHAYSADADFATAEVRIEGVAGPLHWSLSPPGGQSGRWWKLFRVERATSSISFLNAIVDDVNPERSGKAGER